MIYEHRLESIYDNNRALENTFPIKEYGLLLEKFLRSEILNRVKYTTPFRFHFMNPEISIEDSIHFFILISKSHSILKRIYEIPCPKCKSITTIESNKLDTFYCEENDCYPESADFRDLVKDPNFLNKVNILFEIDAELIYFFKQSFINSPDEESITFTGVNQSLPLEEVITSEKIIETLEDDDELVSIITREHWEHFQ